VHAFRLPHALHIGPPFNKSLDISSTHSSLGFGILLLLLLDLIGFSDADFAGYGIDRKSTSGTCHFLYLLWFAGLLENNLQLPNPPQRLSM
jgi:hypothetical protein